MFNGISLPLATVMERGREEAVRRQAAVPQRDTGGQDRFGEELFDALQSSIEKLGTIGRGVQITISEGQISGAGATGSRQFVITVDRADSGVATPGAVATPAQTARSVAAASSEFAAGTLPPVGLTYGSVKDLENPVPQLTSVLQSMGVNTSGISFELVDDAAIGLGGPGHTNHYIRTVLPNGMKEDFSVEWTLRNPKVTAVEIAGMMRRGNSWNPLV